MPNQKSKSNLVNDLSAGLVVFLVALPLCLGIANASGGSPLSGILAGAIGGIVVGLISKSPISVSGPAAGLVAIVLTALGQLNNSFAAFQVALLLAGVIQIALGIFRLGIIASFVPSSVIKGMLAGIGIVIILKQIPHAVGWDKSYEGDFGFLGKFGNTFTDLGKAVMTVSPGAVIIFLVGSAIILLWDSKTMKKLGFTKFVPGALVAVVAGAALNFWFTGSVSSLALLAADGHLVVLPATSELKNSLTFPDWNQISNPIVLNTAVTLAIVASIETLLSIDAADKLDVQRRTTPPNRELIAQGIGNGLCGLIGGLPVTSVVVRSSANAYSGAKTKLSTIVHGILLAAAVITIPQILNLIPLAALASVLILVGWKLTKPALYKQMWSDGIDQFVPFMVTLLGVVFTDILKGVVIGILFGFFFVIRANQHKAFTLVSEGDMYLLRFNKDITFASKAALRDHLDRVPDGASLIINGTQADFVDHDILESIKEYMLNAEYRNISVELNDVAGKTFGNNRKRRHKLA